MTAGRLFVRRRLVDPARLDSLILSSGSLGLKLQIETRERAPLTVPSSHPLCHRALRYLSVVHDDKDRIERVKTFLREKSPDKVNRPVENGRRAVEKNRPVVVMCLYGRDCSTKARVKAASHRRHGRRASQQLSCRQRALC